MIWQVYPRKAGAGQQPCTTEQAPVPCTFNFKKGRAARDTTQIFRKGRRKWNN